MSCRNIYPFLQKDKRTVPVSRKATSKLPVPLRRDSSPDFNPQLQRNAAVGLQNIGPPCVSGLGDILIFALQQAISGKEWHGWKLVEGRSNRRYTNEAAVEQAVTQAGYDPYERKLLGITAMQKMLGKARFDELLTAFIEKPQGKPTLVPESDKRPAMNTAKNDFMEDYDND